MVIREQVEAKWIGNNRKHYEELGYVFTKKDEKFTVYTDELSHGSNITVRYVCDYCKEIHSRKYVNLMRSRGVTGKDCCAKCAPLKHAETIIRRKKSLEENYPKLMEEWCFSSNSFLPSDVSSSSRKLAWWVCKNGHKWKAVIYSRTSGTGCPICSESKGEKAISDILTSRGVPFIREVSFSDLRGEGGRLLRFDFAVIGGRGEIQAIIEYDGPFHFGEVYVGDNNNQIIRHDRIKEGYCKENELRLYRIPHHKKENLEDEVCEIISEISRNFV